MSLINVSSDADSDAGDHDVACPQSGNNDEWLLSGLSETLNVKTHNAPPDTRLVLGKGML